MTKSTAQLFASSAPDPVAFNSREMACYALPWPPSLNRIWRAVNSVVLLSASARQFKRKCANALPKGYLAPIISGRLAVRIVFCPPANEQDVRWDVGNREKLLCDTLTEQRIWVDDSQIDHLTLLRGEPFATGRAIVQIRQYFEHIHTYAPKEKCHE